VLIPSQEGPAVPVVGPTVTLRSAVADCAVGLVESVTVTLTGSVPTALCAGVPVIEPVEVFIERLLGKPVALKMYGVVPPEAVIGVLYATPTVPFGRDVVVIVNLLLTAAITGRFRVAVAVCAAG
jgi:hypothetical protein